MSEKPTNTPPEKMAALARFASIVSHDLNNCLMAVTMNSQLLLKELSEMDSHRDDVKEILEAGLKATALSRQIQKWIPHPAPHLASCDVAQVAQDTIDSLRPNLAPRIQLEMNVRGAFLVSCSSERLREALECLVQNVADFSPDGTRCEITAEVRSEEKGNFVTLTVSDNGPGIAPSVLDRVLEPFCTTKANKKGKGFGLTIAYGIAMECGGSINVRSEPGKGTRVELRLPAKT